MKKRIALAASIALAISVGGMLPASAAKLGAPSVTNYCARAGSTLEIRQSDGDIAVKLTSGGLIDVTFTAGAPASCGSVDLAATGLTSIVLKADDDTSDATQRGNISIQLTVKDSTSDIANFGSIPMSVQAEGELKFDGSGLTGTFLKPFMGTITEEGFTIGSVTGAYYAGSLKFVGGAGNDSIDASAVTTTSFTALGGDGFDVLKGGAETDYLTGEDGGDKLYGNGGDDFLYADEGAEPECVRRNAGKGSGNKNFGQCTQYAYDAPGADEAWGGVGSDTIAGDPSDVVAPGDGADVVTGPVFQLYYGDSSAAITLNLSKEADVVRSTAGDDFYSGAVEEFVGSNFADTMIGTEADEDGVGGVDSFYGLDGADKLIGYSGDDLLSGNGGTDVIKGGLGADEIYGDTGADLINGGADSDVIWMGGGDDIAYGSVGDDILRGQKGSDQAWGGKGTFDVCAAEVTDSCEYKK